MSFKRSSGARNSVISDTSLQNGGPGSKSYPSSPARKSRPSSASSSSSDESRSHSEQRKSQLSNGAASSDTYRHCDKYGFFVEDKEEMHRKASPLSVEVILKREKKWIHMCDHWDKFMTKKWKKLRNRCRKGIPNSVKGRAWFHLCAAFKQQQRHPDLFNQSDQQRGDDKINDEIRKDLNRQFPSHEMFAQDNGLGQQDLYRVLKAYSIVKPKIGYCQGQAPLASVLLMQMPAEHAFWCLVQICDHYLPGYFSPGLEAIQVHGAVLNGLIKRYYPSVYKHMKEQSVDPVLYMTEWFMCVFSRTLPWPSVLRVWDMFMCEGIVIVFKVALILIASVLNDSQARKRCATMYDTLHALRNVPASCLEEEFLVERVIQFDLSNRDLEKEHTRQLLKRKKEKEKMAAKNKTSSSRKR